MTSMTVVARRFEQLTELQSLHLEGLTYFAAIQTR
jgi:hypothetical protein